VQVGDEVTVQVSRCRPSRERISLSLKATQQDPWQEFATGHQVGELVYGRVTKLVPFGAFVQVGEGHRGLVHISEMAVHHVEAPEQVVTPAGALVKIIDIDLDRRRISLSISSREAAWSPRSTRTLTATRPTTSRATTSVRAFEEEADAAGEAEEKPGRRRQPVRRVCGSGGCRDRARADAPSPPSRARARMSPSPPMPPSRARARMPPSRPMPPSRARPHA